MLPSQCNWEIKLSFVPNDFVCLVQDIEHKVKLMIYKMELDFNRIELSPRAAEKVALDIRRNGMLSLPFLDYAITSFNVPNGIQLMTTPTAVINGSPRRIYIFMVRESALLGNQKFNPMHLQNFFLESL